VAPCGFESAARLWRMTSYADPPHPMTRPARVLANNPWTATARAHWIVPSGTRDCCAGFVIVRYRPARLKPT